MTFITVVSFCELKMNSVTNDEHRPKTVLQFVTQAGFEAAGQENMGTEGNLNFPDSRERPPPLSVNSVIFEYSRFCGL